MRGLYFTGGVRLSKKILLRLTDHILTLYIYINVDSRRWSDYEKIKEHILEFLTDTCPYVACGMVWCISIQCALL